MRLVKCSVAGWENSKMEKRKTVLNKHGKKILSTAENELVIMIPLILWIRPFVVQPDAIVVVIEFEDVLVTSGSFM